MSANGVNKRNSLVLFVVLLAIGAAVLAGYYFLYLPSQTPEPTSTAKSKILMDTVVDVRVDGVYSEELVAEIFALMEELEGRLSRFLPDSEVAQINRQAGQWVSVSAETLELIELGIELGDLTAGAFDMTIGGVLDLWGFGTGVYYVPSEEELAEALTTVDYRMVEMNKGEQRVRIPAGTVLDLGAIAKGYIIDQAIARLREANVERAIINAGGDIAVIGQRPDGNAWRVGVQDPEELSEIRWVLPLVDQSVVTSGDYQRYFMVGEERYHHIIDPRTGYPARDLISVTVVGANSAVCDALSTAIFVLGPEDSGGLLEELPEFETILVSSRETWISPGLAEAIKTQ